MALDPEKESVPLDLADLGFLPDSLENYERGFHKAYGTVLVTGPTGSGKSTMLYATLNALNDPGRHIVTAEDLVEYRLPGLTQCQMNPRAGLTFATAMRSFLRSDPNVILVGWGTRRRDRGHRRRGGPHGTPGALDAPHERRPGIPPRGWRA